MENDTQVTQQTIAEEKEAAHQERKDRRRLHPVLLSWLQAQTRLMETPAPLKGSDGKALPFDLFDHASCHPDVAQLKKLPGMTEGVAVSMAWTLWRARQLLFWSRNLAKDTVILEQHEGITIPVTKHRGVDTISWTQALEHADARDEFHDLIMERRAASRKRRAVQEQEQTAIALLISGLGSMPVGPDRDGASAGLLQDAASISELITMSRAAMADGEGYKRRKKGYIEGAKKEQQ